MKQKGQLKDSQEILDSLNRKPKPAPAPDAVQAAPAAEELAAPPPAQRRRRGRPPRRDKQDDLFSGDELRSLQQIEDRLPLNFEKYNLPEAPPSAATPLPEAAPPQQPSAPPATAAPADPVVAPAPPPANAPKAPAEAPEVADYHFEEFEAPREPDRASAQPKARGSQADQPKFTPVTDDDHKHAVIIDSGYRDEFMQRISNQFDQAFSQRFTEKETSLHPVPEKRDRGWFERIETAGDAPAAAPTPPELRERRRAPDRPATAEDDQGTQQEANSFLEDFAARVREEEKDITENFKETLTEKFMRERERYLKELNIEQDARKDKAAPSGPENSHPARKRLDFQIQPEMHRQDDSAAPAGLTYTSRAQIRQTPEPEEAAAPMGGAQKAEPAAGRTQAHASSEKKTGADLINELAQQVDKAQIRLQAKPQARPAATPAGVPGKAKPSRMRAAVLAVLAVGAVAFAAVVGIPILLRMNSLPDTDEPPATVGSQKSDLVAYESRLHETMRGDYENVLVKRAVTLANLSAGNYLVIEDMKAAGAVTLRDVGVADAIYIRECAITELNLHNVSANRIVLTNKQGPVSINISGLTDIDTLEARSPVVVTQNELDPSASGLSHIVSGSEGDASDIRLSGVLLKTLMLTGTGVMNFEDSNVERLISDGDLSLHGTGRIMNLTLGAGPDAAEVLLDLKGVEVANLDVKSPGNLEISARVDNLGVSDNVGISGNGQIGSMMINTKFGAARLQIDVSGPNVVTMIANAEIRLVSDGAAQVNTLIANASAYALGNKLNQLVVNNDRVIYEQEPDRIEVSAGIRPPQTVADNPNLDYTLSTAQSDPASLDASVDDVSTTCGHPRESGGFLLGDGSTEHPYEVTSAVQLAHITAHPSSHYLQTANIDISADGRYSDGFEMICPGGVPFSGTFDGRGYLITNLRIASAREGVGLFAGNSGVLRNINLYSGDISSTAATTAYVGGIVGINNPGGEIWNSSNRARVTGQNNSYSGGIAGYNYGGKITDCYNVARITQGVAGGIAGFNSDNGRIAGCYNIGEIAGRMAGSVVGTNAAGASVANCYYLFDTAPAGIGDGDTNATVWERTFEELASAQMVTDLAAGDLETPWIQGDENYQYPQLILNTD